MVECQINHFEQNQVGLSVQGYDLIHATYCQKKKKAANDMYIYFFQRLVVHGFAYRRWNGKKARNATIILPKFVRNTISLGREPEILLSGSSKLTVPLGRNERQMKVRGTYGNIKLANEKHP